MKISNVLILLALGSFALMLQGCSNQEAAKIVGPIKTKLNAEIANMACVPAGVLPFSSKGRSGGCFECDKFVDAGLLTKEVIEDPSSPAPDIRFELTDIGKETYFPGTSDSAYGKDAARFCFGQVRVNQITRIIGPVMNGNVKMFGIRYVAELEGSNPFIFDPRAKFLRIPLPIGGPMSAGKPVLYPERNITAIFNSNNPTDFELDASMTIGN